MTGKEGGVVASILWGIGGAVYERMGQVRFANDLLAISINLCSSDKADNCIELAYKTHRDLVALDSAGIVNILFFSLTPIILAWLVACLALKIFQWVKAGF